MLGISPLYASAKYILVGFSGGADSSLLLEYFVNLRNTVESFPEVRAIHVNHMLRKGEADKDEAFCKERCKTLGVPLTVCRINIPKMMEKTGMGAEECARVARYSAFNEEADKLGEGVLIATAHNADDNLETVIFNLARGGGASGLSGIPPVREGRIIRPLLGIGSAEIREACKKEGIPYVTDSTNTDQDYTRNFIRHSVVPSLKKINPSAADAAVRAGISLREDEDFMRKLASDAIGSYLPSKSSDSAEVPRNVMASLPPAVLSRAIISAVGKVTDIAMSAEQIRLCRKMVLKSGTGKVSLPDGVTFEVSKNLVSVFRPCETAEFLIPIELPAADECVKCSCDAAGFDLYICKSLAGLPEKDENIYKLSIHTALRFDTIYGKVYVRSRKGGDTLSLGGHTRRLKKMICDYGIPESRRARLPVICDDMGVLLVPGLPERGPSYARPEDYESNNVLYILYCMRR